MKRILIGLGTLVFVGALAVSATGAFFSDSETSTGNSFTAGAIDLKVDDTQHYAGLVCTNTGTVQAPVYTWIQDTVMGPNPTTRPDLLNQPCSGTWALKDLIPGTDKFFNFTDVKPGDSGENTISLHIDNNSAYACADLSNIHNDDNTNLTPEVLAGDGTPGPVGGGELGQNLDFLVWNDNGAQGHAGNNIWDADEVGTNTTGGAPTDNATYTLADSSGPAIPPTGTSYLGIAWCAGTFTAGGPGVTPVCDGSTMGNQAQTDSYTADIGIRVVQSRNNGQFICTPPEVVQRPTVGALLSAQVFPEICNVTVNPDADIATPETITAGIAAATTGQTVCVVGGTYSEDVNVNKSITLVGAGSATTNIIGQTSGEPGALAITADNVTVKGFNVTEATGGVAAVRISGAHSGITINNNQITGSIGGNAFLADGGQTNHTISNNIINGGDAGQPIAYVNGLASVNVASTNVDFTNNTFGGSGSEALGEEAGASSITQNKFSAVTSFTDVEDWEGGNNYNQNNFNDGGLNLQHSENVNTGDNGITNAENNWWGDTNPADGDVNANVDVDFTPFEVSAFPQN